MTHSDFRTNETEGNLKEEKYTITSSTAVNITKRQKIILKQASYICPKVTWVTENINGKDNTHNNEDCAMFADEQGTATSSMTCVSIRDGNLENMESRYKRKLLKLKIVQQMEFINVGGSKDIFEQLNKDIITSITTKEYVF